MRSKRSRTIVFLVCLAVVVGVFWRYYSPYKICLRHAQAEGVTAGMSAEGAAGYAEGLCTSKMPLRN